MKRLIATLAAAAAVCCAPAAQATTQFAALPGPDDDALRVCALAQTAGMERATLAESIGMVADSAWFMFEQVDREPNETYLQSIKQKSDNMKVGDLPAINANAAAIVSQCATRWPASQRSMMIVLPDNKVDRAGICLGSAALILGMAQAAKDTELTALAQGVIAWSTPQLTPKFSGVGDEAAKTRINGALSGWIRAGHHLGNINSIVQACDALIPRQ